MSCPLSQAFDFKKQQEACRKEINKFKEGFNNGTLTAKQIIFFKDATDKYKLNGKKRDEYNAKVSKCKRENKVSTCKGASCYGKK